MFCKDFNSFSFIACYSILTLFQLGSGVTLPTGGGPLWPASVLSVIKPLKDY